MQQFHPIPPFSQILGTTRDIWRNARKKNAQEVSLLIGTTERPGYHAQKFIRTIMQDDDESALAVNASSAFQTALHSYNSKRLPRDALLSFLHTTLALWFTQLSV